VEATCVEATGFRQMMNPARTCTFSN